MPASFERSVILVRHHHHPVEDSTIFLLCFPVTQCHFPGIITWDKCTPYNNNRNDNELLTNHLLYCYCPAYESNRNPMCTRHEYESTTNQYHNCN